MNLPCGPPSNLCVSAFNGHFNAEAAKIRRAPQRKRIKFATFCAKPILLENVNRPTTRHARWNQLTQVVRIRFWIKKSGAKEGNELTKLVNRQYDWCREGGINAR